MTSPWYRSRLFWFGIPVLLCLLWIWLGYLRNERAVCWGNSHAEYCLGWGGDGAVAFVINKHSPSVGGPPDIGFYGYDEELPSDWEIDIFPPALWIAEDRILIAIANWFLVTVYLIIWIAALVIWQRRKRRFQRRHQEGMEQGGGLDPVSRPPGT